MASTAGQDDREPRISWNEHADAAGLVAALSTLLHESAAQALAARGRAVFALAGGRTPLPAYRGFAARPLPPGELVVLPTDERCVPHAHAASNVGELRAIFGTLPGVTVDALTTPDGDADASAGAAAAMLARHAGPFDLVVLGMGADAHTASLFPGAPQLAAALDAATARDACRVDPDPLPPEAPFARITLTAARLLRTRALHLVVTGEAKREVLEAALSPGADPMRAPVAAILHAPGAHVHVHWSP